jgi:hypothetical protein
MLVARLFYKLLLLQTPAAPLLPGAPELHEIVTFCSLSSGSLWDISTNFE